MSGVAPTTTDSTAQRAVFMRRALAVSFLVLVCATAYWVGAHSRHSTINGGLVIPADKLDFGEVWENMDFPWTLPIHNPTSHAIIIDKFVSSCHCLVAEQDSVTVGSGETTEIRLRLDLTRFQRGDGDVRSWSARIAPMIEGKLLQEDGWSIEGRVRKCLTLPESELSFRNSLVQGENFPTQSFTVFAHTGVHEVRPLHDASILTAKAVRAQPAVFRVEVTLSSSAPVGSLTSEIKLEAHMEDGTNVKAGRALVKAHVQRAISFVPDAILLGYKPVGAKVEEIVTLRCLREETFTVEEVVVSGTDLKVDALLPKEPMRSRTLRIVQTITQEGEQTRDIRVVVRRYRDANLMSIPLLVSYHGRLKRANAVSHPFLPEYNR